MQLVSGLNTLADSLGLSFLANPVNRSFPFPETELIASWYDVTLWRISTVPAVGFVCLVCCILLGLLHKLPRLL